MMGSSESISREAAKIGMLFPNVNRPVSVSNLSKGELPNGSGSVVKPELNQSPLLSIHFETWNLDHRWLQRVEYLSENRHW